MTPQNSRKRGRVTRRGRDAYSNGVVKADFAQAVTSRAESLCSNPYVYAKFMYLLQEAAVSEWMLSKESEGFLEGLDIIRECAFGQCRKGWGEGPGGHC